MQELSWCLQLQLSLDAADVPKGLLAVDALANFWYTGVLGLPGGRKQLTQAEGPEGSRSSDDDGDGSVKPASPRPCKSFNSRRAAEVNDIADCITRLLHRASSNTAARAGLTRSAYREQALQELVDGFALKLAVSTMSTVTGFRGVVFDPSGRRLDPEEVAAWREVRAQARLGCADGAAATAAAASCAPPSITAEVLSQPSLLRSPSSGDATPDGPAAVPGASQEALPLPSRSRLRACEQEHPGRPFPPGATPQGGAHGGELRAHNEREPGGTAATADEAAPICFYAPEQEPVFAPSQHHFSGDSGAAADAGTGAGAGGGQEGEPLMDARQQQALIQLLLQQQQQLQQQLLQQQQLLLQHQQVPLHAQTPFLHISADPLTSGVPARLLSQALAGAMSAISSSSSSSSSSSAAAAAAASPLTAAPTFPSHGPDTPVATTPHYHQTSRSQRQHQQQPHLGYRALSISASQHYYPSHPPASPSPQLRHSPASSWGRGSPNGYPHTPPMSASIASGEGGYSPWGAPRQQGYVASPSRGRGRGGRGGGPGGGYGHHQQQHHHHNQH